MKKLGYIILLFLAVSMQAQELTGKQLLEKAMQFHDPDGKWDTFKGTLFVTMETPKSPKRDTEINIDILNEYFSANAKSGNNTTYYELNKGKCTIKFNGKAPTEEEKKTNKLSCDRATMYKNYYTYLYGLPMKLKDPGARISETTMKKEFKGKEYLVLKVTYDEEVGSDVWYFYFDPATYAMEVYQFYKKDKPQSGEYILLKGIETIGGVRMPKTRAWYYNKDDKYLGTDILKASF